MTQKISQLTPIAKLPNNISLYETSEPRPFPAVGYDTSSVNRIQLTKRVYFTKIISQPTTNNIPVINIAEDDLLQMCDTQAYIDATAGNGGSLISIGGNYSIHCNVVERGSSAPTIGGQYRYGTSISHVIFYGTEKKVRTLCGAPALDNFVLDLPNPVTYSIGGTTTIYPYVSNILYGNSFGGLQVNFGFAFDDYATLPAQLLVTGFIDCEPFPLYSYEPS